MKQLSIDNLELVVKCPSCQGIWALNKLSGSLKYFPEYFPVGGQTQADITK